MTNSKHGAADGSNRFYNSVCSDTQCHKQCAGKGAWMKFWYARVSTDEQKLDLQLDALRTHGVNRARVYVDARSVRYFRMPKLQGPLKAMRGGDECVAWWLDRDGASTKELLATVELLCSR
ncbi:DNA invertase Pin-like site-specific DNA recombinase [Sphingomonas yantingensis]|uniref:DNA invertase Pin-like site-specific DNA recombinase n=1 Tax=Sphingomonas yantingensis TaxID=1241761 RepID=A0A7W9EKB3_9SPHN|nr:DNA invertase Pin-like site-specific DNA recombinase [Sphingomonas yantingensis]